MTFDGRVVSIESFRLRLMENDSGIIFGEDRHLRDDGIDPPIAGQLDDRLR